MASGLLSAVIRHSRQVSVAAMSGPESQFSRIEHLLREAREVSPPQLETWLSGLDDPPEIVDAVRRTLKAVSDRTSDILPTEATRMETSAPSGDRLKPPGGLEPDPLTIGPYEVKRRLGEGGFGVVFLAHQEEPIRRDVAIKVVRAGLGGSNVLVRFEAERQALAMMSHPGLATVIDAGATEDGDPYFVMEYVAGSPVDELCDRLQLDVRGRIELFIEICEAIQHAHGKGIIHRDLKPGNILVAPDGKQLLPRVIDFGIAKALDPDTIGTGSVTVEGQFIGTPHYMAPEQTGFTGQDVDVRADVFSLGSVLYELLVGRTPIDLDTIARAREEGGLGALQQVLCERPAIRASTCLNRILREEPERGESIARRRGCDGRGLVRQLKGDLDWILLKALEIDRDRRYETPLGLADDLRRHLGHEPVRAGPPSRAYRFSKFVRRNRAAVVAVVVVFVVLVVAAIYSNSARLTAEQRLQETESTLTYVDSSIGKAVDPSYGGGRDLLAVDYFSNAYDSIESDASLSPRVKVRLYLMYARVLIALNDYEKGAECALAGLAVIEENDLQQDFIDSANELRFHLAQAWRSQGLQSDVAALEETIDTSTPEFMASRAFTLHNAGDYDGARWFYEQERAKRSPDGDSFPLSECLGFLGRLDIDEGRLDSGTALIRDSAEMCARLSENNGSSVAASWLALGSAEAAALRLEAALEHYENAHALYLDLHGTGEVFMVEVCRIEIEGLLEDAMVLGIDLEATVPPPNGIANTDFLQAIILRNRARILQRAGHGDAALDLIERSMAVEGVDGDYHRHTRLALARMLLIDGRAEQALEVIDELLAELPFESADALPGEPPARAMRVGILIELDRLPEARLELDRLRALRSAFPAESPPQATINNYQSLLNE